MKSSVRNALALAWGAIVVVMTMFATGYARRRWRRTNLVNRVNRFWT